MLMCCSCSSCSSAMTGSIARVMRIVVLAVGRLRPPFLDDVAHYEKLLRGQARVELIEVRDSGRGGSEEQIERRIPERAFVSVLDSGGEMMDSVGFSRFIEE